MKRNIEILLVDDDPAVRGVFARVLLQAGFGVASVSSGEAALELLRRGQRFDVIVSDFAMPGLCGHALVQRFQRLDRGVPIIVVTGSSQAARGIERGGLRCLLKPIDNAELIEAVTHAAAPREPH